ncbi:MAG TPA: DUF2202 domain-containing protein [Chitinophagaceae bacterium]
MRTSKIKLPLLISLFSGAFLFTSCSKDEGPANNNSESNGNINIANLQVQIGSLPKDPLNQAELNSLSIMREEEKLARDVYIILYNKWGANILNNISTSEQTHMEALLLLVQRYSLADPVGNNAIGVFKNTTIQNLYDQLIAKGNISVSEAYQVGATIEDLDIYDLQRLLVDVDNQDIRLVYDMLTKGSRNHLRSFYWNILNIGGTYIPKYITRTEFDAIVNSSMETGF